MMRRRMAGVMDAAPYRKSPIGVQSPEANSLCHGCRGVFCGSAGRLPAR